MEDLKITVDEKNFEAGIREILSKIRPNWTKEKIQFKVSLQKESESPYQFFLSEERKKNSQELWRLSIQVFINRKKKKSAR